MVRNTWICLVLVGLIAGFAVPTALCQTTQNQPDLAFQQQVPEGCLLLSSSAVTKGGAVHASATVVNRESGSVDSFDVEFVWRRVDKQEICGFERLTIVDLQSLGYKASIMVDTSDLTPGAYELAVSIDPENRIAEVDETNNRCSANVQILSLRPEVHPISLYTNLGSPIEWGETVRVLTELENTGDREAGEFHVAFGIAPISLIDPTTGQKRLISIQTVGGADSEGGPVRELVFGEVDLDVQGHSIEEENWIPFGSVVVAGLERDAHRTVHGVLDSAGQLDTLLGTFLNSAFTDLTSKTPKDLIDDEREELARISEQLVRMKTGITTYAIRAKVGEPYGLVEQDPNNNTVVGYLTIKPSTLHLAELRPVGVTFTHDMPFEWGYTIGARVSVVNLGSPAADPSPQDGPIQVWFYLREIGQGAGDWGNPLKPIPTIAEIQIEGRNTEDAVINLDFPRPGSYELRVWVDPTNIVRESNEDNNEITVGLSVQGSELHPQSIELGGAPIHQGDTIAVIAQIENTGIKPAETFTVGFSLDEVRLDTFYYSGEGLGKNGIVKVQGVLDTTDLPHGDYVLRVVVDPDDQIPEKDEANNVLSMPLVINPPEARYAELSPIEVTLESPLPLPIGQEVHVKATVRNSGNIDAERFQVRFSFEKLAGGMCAENVGRDCATCWQKDLCRELNSVSSCCQCVTVDGLARGAKEAIEGCFSTAGLQPGEQYRLKVIVDPPGANEGTPQGEVPEMDEANNELFAYFTVGELSGAGPADAPNLLCQEFTVRPATLTAGTPVEVCGTVVNTGREEAGPFLASLYRGTVSGVALASQAFGGLGVGESLTLKCEILETTQWAAGTHQISCVVDAENKVEEQNEADNECSRPVTIIGGPAEPNIAPISVRFAPSAKVSEGEPVNAIVVVENRASSCNASFDVTFTQSGEGYETTFVRTVDALRATERRELWQPMDTAVPGEYMLTIDVDSGNRIAETSETDNQIEAQFEVTTGRIPTVDAFLTGGAVRFLRIDGKTGTVYATSDDGHIYLLERGHAFSNWSDFPIEEGSDITAFVINPGAARTAYVGTSTGVAYAIDLDSGDHVAAPVSLAGTIFDLALDSTGHVFAGTDEGLIRLDWRLRTVGRSIERGKVNAVVVDDSRATVYALTPAGLQTFDFACARRGCEAASLQGTPSALALGADVVLVGTDSGMVYAFEFCNSSQQMRQRYSLAAEGTITSIAVDEKGGPHVASSVGKLYTLGSNGQLTWTFPSAEGEYVGGIYSVAAIDGRTGQVFFGDSDEKAYVLTHDGRVALTFDLKRSERSPIGSSPVIDSVIVRDGASTRLIRAFYYGVEDGHIYRIQTDR